MADRKQCVARDARVWGSTRCPMYAGDDSDLCKGHHELLLPMQLIAGVLYMGDAAPKKQTTVREVREYGELYAGVVDLARRTNYGIRTHHVVTAFGQTKANASQTLYRLCALGRLARVRAGVYTVPG